MVFRFFISKPTKSNSDISNTIPTKTQNSEAKISQPEKIIKCQNVLISPEVTTELFTYKSGKYVLADYRVNATSNEKSFKIQILSDGEWVYMWKPPLNFGQDPKPENPPGIKTKIKDFNLNINLTELGSIQRFGKSPLSGDHLCSEWDGLSSIFDLPTDFIFNESQETDSIKAELSKICQICNISGGEESASVCRKNLACD